MNAALQAIRDDLSVLRARIDPLEKAEALLTPLYEPADPVRAAKPKRGADKTSTPQRQTQKRRRRNPSRLQIRDYIISHGPLTRGELLIALGGHPKAMSTNLKRLLEDGEIDADPHPGGRLYRAPRPKEHPSDAIPSTPPLAQHGVTSGPGEPPPLGAYPVYDVITTHGAATSEQLVTRTGLAKPIVIRQCQRLKQSNLLKLVKGDGEKPVWMLWSALTDARDAA
jgi:hypothetical protein